MRELSGDSAIVFRVQYGIGSVQEREREVSKVRLENRIVWFGMIGMGKSAVRQLGFVKTTYERQGADSNDLKFGSELKRVNRMHCNPIGVKRAVYTRSSTLAGSKDENFTQQAPSFGSKRNRGTFFPLSLLLWGMGRGSVGEGGYC